MKKRLFVILAFFVLCGTLFSGCGEKPQPTESYSITLDQSTLSLAVYGRQVLAAVVTNSTGEQVQDVTVTWSSSDPAVATVEDGVVTAKGEGSAEIIAKLANGESATCRVTAEATAIVPMVEVKSVTDNCLSIATGQTFRLDSTVTFGGKDCTDADTVFTYQTEDSAVATVSADGVITGVKEGSTRIIVTAAWRGLGGKEMTGGEKAYGLKIVIDLKVIAP